MKIMKLKKEFIAHNSADESVLVPSGSATFAGIVRGNQTFGALLQLLREETDEETVVRAMCARYNGDEQIIARDVHRAVEELRGIGALEE